MIRDGILPSSGELVCFVVIAVDTEFEEACLCAGDGQLHASDR